MTFNFSKSFCAVTLTILLTACSSARDIVGLGKQSPDEFEVVTRAPLSLPPDYGLRVPAPNTGRPQEKSARERADDLISAKNDRPLRQKRFRERGVSKVSPAEDAILSRAQAKGSFESVRADLDSDNQRISNTDKKLIEKIIFWQGTKKTGAVLDPNKESKRIKGLESEGKPYDKSPVPVIERADWGLFDGLF